MTRVLTCDIERPDVSGDDVRDKYPTYEHPHLSYSSSFVYVVGPEGGPYKVGYSGNPLQRLAMLALASPVRMCVWMLSQTPSGVGMWVERQVQSALKKSHVRGEWFKADICHIKNLVELANPMGRHVELGGLTIEELKKAAQ